MFAVLLSSLSPSPSLLPSPNILLPAISPYLSMSTLFISSLCVLFFSSSPILPPFCLLSFLPLPLAPNPPPPTLRRCYSNSTLPYAPVLRMRTRPRSLLAGTSSVRWWSCWSGQPTTTPALAQPPQNGCTRPPTETYAS